MCIKMNTNSMSKKVFDFHITFRSFSQSFRSNWLSSFHHRKTLSTQLDTSSQTSHLSQIDILNAKLQHIITKYHPEQSTEVMKCNTNNSNVEMKCKSKQHKEINSYFHYAKTISLNYTHNEMNSRIIIIRIAGFGLIRKEDQTRNEWWLFV